MPAFQVSKIIFFYFYGIRGNGSDDCDGWARNEEFFIQPGHLDAIDGRPTNKIMSS